MAKTKVAADIGKLSFEQALKELEEIVRKLEAGEAKLDEAVGAYERGAALKQHCEAKLREAQAKVDQIQFTAEGAVSVKPANID